MHLTKREEAMHQADLEGYNAYRPGLSTSNPYTSLDKGLAAAWQVGYARARTERNLNY